MDLSTRYLGLDLASPYMPGASPLVDDLDTVRHLEDAGAPAIVMHSLFEEQIQKEELGTFANTESHGQSFAEAMSYFPSADAYALGPYEYVEQLRRIKAAVGVPVIASLNGSSIGGWLDYAKLLQEAGADALELNVYALETDFEIDGRTVEERTVEMLRLVKEKVSVPVAVKLSPFYSSLAHFASRLAGAGADGLVLFNRFYQPDIDVEKLQVERALRLSDRTELPLRLRWLAVLSGSLECGFAASGGVHTSIDGIKALMAGAHAVQLVSALLQRGPGYLATLRADTARFLEEHEYESLGQLRGSMNLASCPDPAAYERANYMLILQSWRSSAGMFRFQ